MTHTLCAKLSLVVIGMLLLPAPAAASAQSLGEVARQYRKELEAREKKGEVPARVFTNDDIFRMPPVGILGSSSRPPSESRTKPPPPSQPQGATVGKSPAGSSARKTGKTEKEMRSKEYWQTRFKTARNALKYAREELKVVENELELLQIQQARELDPNRSRKLNGRIDTATIEMHARRAAEQKARQALEKLEKEFKESGAPQAWIAGQGNSEKAGAETASPSGPGAATPPRR